MLPWGGWMITQIDLQFLIINFLDILSRRSQVSRDYPVLGRVALWNIVVFLNILQLVLFFNNLFREWYARARSASDLLSHAVAMSETTAPTIWESVWLPATHGWVHFFIHCVQTILRGVNTAFEIGSRVWIEKWRMLYLLPDGIYIWDILDIQSIQVFMHRTIQ